VVDSLQRGDRVIATGKLVRRSWQTDDGEKRTVIELIMDEIGPIPEMGYRHSDTNSS
jgi:single-strand DNA-binding protein